MSNSPIFSDPLALKALADRLNTISAVSRHSRSEVTEGEVIAHAISDLEDSFVKCLAVIFPKIQAASRSGIGLNDAMEELMFELVHVSYHLNDSTYIKEFLEITPIASHDS